MFPFAAKFETGLTYSAFLDRYATPEQRRRWNDLPRSTWLEVGDTTGSIAYQRDYY